MQGSLDACKGFYAWPHCIIPQGVVLPPSQGQIAFADYVCNFLHAAGSRKIKHEMKLPRMGGVEAGCEVAPGSDVAPGMNVCKGSTVDAPSGHAQKEADSEMAFSRASFINGLMGQIRRSQDHSCSCGQLQLVDMECQALGARSYTTGSSPFSAFFLLIFATMRSTACTMLKGRNSWPNPAVLCFKQQDTAHQLS